MSSCVCVCTLCVHAHFVACLLACLLDYFLFFLFLFSYRLCFLDLKNNLNFSWQVQASSILCVYPFLVICITRQTSLHCFFFCESWTWKVSMVFFKVDSSLVWCFHPLVGRCDKWPQNRHEVENMAKTPTQIGQYFNDNFNMYCVIHIK